MKIKKITALALCGILTISLCGCDKQNSDSTDNSADSDNSEISSSAPVIYPIPDDATFLKGAAGDLIGLSEITAVWDLENREISPEDMTADNFFRAVIDSAYYALPIYPCLTDLDNEYDEDALLFKDVPQTDQSIYYKVKKGDKILGLTVAEASSEFNLNAPAPGVVTGTSLVLDGEITLSGYARVIPGDEYGVAVGDIIFLPAGNAELPVVRFDDCDENGVISRRTGDVYIMNNITYTNEFADRFVLGNINDTAADISVLPSDGSFIKANVTISDIRMNSTVNWLTQVNANLVSIAAD